MSLVKDDRHKRPATRRVDALTVLLVAAQRAKKIGARMRELRDELGLTQTEVAERIGGSSVTKDYISRWERGSKEPSEAYLDQIATALQTTVADLMAGPVSERAATNGPTPDLFGGQDDDAPQLDRIEAKLDRVLDLLDPPFNGGSKEPTVPPLDGGPHPPIDEARDEPPTDEEATG